MKFTTFQDKAFQILEWIFFIGFSIVALWFASGVLEQFFSHKTSFSQYEEEVAYYPVISIFFYDYQASEVNPNDTKIHYGNPNPVPPAVESLHSANPIDKLYLMQDSYFTQM